MHPTQLEILDSLRQQSSCTFSTLLKDVAETSDNLTYHIKRLQQAGLVESASKGSYSLAQKGIIYLNNNLELNHDLFPTLSCMLELHSDTKSNTILVMKKLKQPYLGSYHLPTFGVTSEHTLSKQIESFLRNYHIQATDITFKCNYRERVHDKEGVFIFDKLFLVFTGKFSYYKGLTEDREFLVMEKAELIANSSTLLASRAVVEIGHNSGFIDTVCPAQ